jgi:peptidoglycan/LPS O-acetylase OafA/YrhL
MALPPLAGQRPYSALIEIEDIANNALERYRRMCSEQRAGRPRSQAAGRSLPGGRCEGRSALGSVAPVAIPAHTQSPVDRAVAPQTAPAYSVELESLRGLAMLLVSAFHIDLIVMARFHIPAGTIASPAIAYVRAGHTGVSLFFVLSGFLLGREFFGEIAGGEPVNRRRYAVRRALRILPLYYAVVVLASVSSATRTADVLHGAPYLLFLNAFMPSTVPLGSFSGVWWSLATEVQFYLALPAIAALLRPARRWLGVALLAAWAVAYAAFVFDGLRPPTFAGQQLLAHSLFGVAPLFLNGATAAWLHVRAGARARRWMAASVLFRYGGADLLLLAAMGSLGLLLRAIVHLGPAFDLPPHQVWHLAEGLLWAAVLVLLLDAPLRLKPVLSNRVLAGCGTISYSMYLIHVPLIAALLALARTTRLGSLTGWSWRTALVMAALTAVCFVVATATYALIERPCLALKSRLN